MSTRRILITNSDKLARKSLYELLCRHEYEVDVAESAKDALTRLGESLYHLLLADINEKETTELLAKVRDCGCQCKVIILTSYGNVETAVDSMKMGAFDYLVQPIEDKKIISAIERALSGYSNIIEEAPFRFEKFPHKEHTFHGLVGKSRPMQDIYTLLEQISNSRATVLLRGESGTGKRLIAHALHMTDKKRRHKPFIEMSCGALPREIIESELFGHAKGAFTGAISDRKGRFELAHGGTILLDDIDSLAPDLQVKLLRVLQHKEFERVGENRTIKVDVRIVVSTNQDLEKAVVEKKFREDLYYRLNVISVNVPPLRDRKDDLSFLVEHFVNMFSKENNKKISGISDDILPILMSYNWPGNVRELENIIERAVILDTNGVIERADLPDIILNGNAYLSPAAADAKDGVVCLRDALEEPEKVYILRVLKDVGWNKKKAAVRLGVNRTTLYNKLRKYKINSAPVKN